MQYKVLKLFFSALLNLNNKFGRLTIFPEF